MNYGHATVVLAEGARVGILTCPECGAAILADPRDNGAAIDAHDRWHDELRRIAASDGRDDGK